MKKLFFFILLFSHFTLFAFDDGSDKTIKKYLKAIGGAKEWETVKTLKFAMHDDKKELGEYFTTISILREKGYRRERVLNTEIEKLQGGTPSVDSYYNETAWRVFNDPYNPKIDDKKKDSIFRAEQKKKWGMNQVNDMSNNKHWIQPIKWTTQIPWCFINYESKGYKATYKGDSKISFDEVLQIEMISQTGDTANYFFSKKTSLLLKVGYKTKEFTYSNCKQVDNVKIPFEMIESRLNFFKNNEPYMLWYTIDQVKLNEPMDEKIFMKPKQ